MAIVSIEAPRLYPKQHAAIFDPNRHSFIEASTKVGKTAGCIIWQMDQCCAHPGEHWWIAPIRETAKIAYKRAKKYIPKSLYRKNDSEQAIYLVNGSTWVFKGSDKPDSLYGEDAQSVVVDEASRCKEEVWPAVRSVLTATGGQSRIIGNVKGRKNWFYREARKAKAGMRGYGYHKLTAWDAVAAGLLPRLEVESAQRDLPDHVFRELYLAEASEDGANPFGVKHIEAITSANLIMSDQMAVAWGVDLAKYHDWTVIVGLNEAGDVCSLYRFQKPWRETIPVIRAIVGTDPCLVDASGIGDAVLEYLQGDDERDNFEGFVFTSSSKQRLMKSLALEVHQHAFLVPPGIIPAEMEEFEFTHYNTGIRYEAASGHHDDSVCALALSRAKWRAREDDVWW